MTDINARVGRNLPIAAGVGLSLVALIIATLSFNRLAFAILVALVMIPAMWELSAAFGRKSIHIDPYTASLTAVVIVMSTWFKGLTGLAIAVGVTIPILLIIRLRSGVSSIVADSTATLFSILYVPVPISFAVLLAQPADGRARVMTFIAAVAMSDTGGLFAGALLGKHRIAPNISPKKSFEGLIGSFIFSIGIAGWLYAVWMDHPFWQGAILGFVATITATGGDLIESALKRDLGVKDMGHLLPGHGGFLDRLDSLVLTAPFAYFIITYFVSP